MARFKDQAICIREIDWSETSQIVVLVTEHRGKIRGLAKGSKRLSPSSIQRFSGGIDLLTRGQVVGVIKPSSELATLTEWDLQNDYHHLRTNLESQRLAMFGADLVDALIAERDPHTNSFNAISQFLQKLIDPDHNDMILLQFQWEILADAGFKPELDNDIHSTTPLKQVETYTFDPKAGGFTDRKGISDLRVRKQTIELLRTVDTGQVPNTNDHQSILRANRLLCVYARSILDKQLPTMNFILDDHPS